MNILFLTTGTSYESQRYLEALKTSGDSFSHLDLLSPGQNLLFEDLAFFNSYEKIIMRLPDPAAYHYGVELRKALLTRPHIRHKLFNGEAYYNQVFSKVVQQFLLTQAHLPTPKTLFSYTYDPTQLQFPLVAKALYSSMGRGVRQINNVQEFDNFVTKFGAGNVLLQECLPVGTDYRVIVAHQQALGVMRRHSQDGFLSNINAGGVGSVVTGSEAQPLMELATKVADALGCDYAGVDLMLTSEGKPVVIEVNIGADFHEFEKVTKQKVAETVIQGLHRSRVGI